MTTDELAPLRRALLKKGAELADILAGLLAGKQVTIAELLAPKPGETPIEKVRRYLDGVDRKIKAIDDGSYGSCDGCGAALPFAELQALPWMDRCRACAAQGR